MKSIAIAILAATALCACTTTTVTSPDGTVRKTTSQDPAVVSAVMAGVTDGIIQGGTAYLKSREGYSK